MYETGVYHSPILLSPKQRLERIVSGLLYALQQRLPLLSIEEQRTWLGLVLCSNHRQIVNQTLARLEQK